jgi:diguanylate cyclase (GGDEF)-like protein
MSAQATPLIFGDDRFPASLRADDIRVEPIAITPKTVQDILAYVAEKEQSLADLRGRVAELERLLETDELTGLLNRRGFEAAARRTLAGAARYREAGVLALIDLDRFKTVNDNHGHAAGDAALRLVGQILSENVRATDYAARLSGDEFAILWVRAVPSALPQRIRTLKQRLDGAILEWGDTTIALKASVGTVTYDNASPLDVLLRQADQAMYREKRARRAQAEPSNDISGA